MASRLAAVFLLATGCMGSIEPLPHDHTSGATGDPGGGAAPAPDAAPASDPTGDPPAACLDVVATNVSGHHNAGFDCSTCHTGQTAAPRWTAAGTLYRDAAGSAAIAGAWIHLTDSGGTEVVIETAQNGNFWTDMPLRFPVTARASGCPDVVAMIGPVVSSGCNANGCHGATSRIHLP